MAALVKYAPYTFVYGIELKLLDAYASNLLQAKLNPPDPIVGSSNDPATVAKFKKLSGNKEIDFLFIDGDHSINGSAKDLELWAPLVKIGGYMALHDTACATNLMAHHLHFDVSHSLALWYQQHGANWIAAKMVDTITSFQRIK